MILANRDTSHFDIINNYSKKPMYTPRIQIEFPHSWDKHYWLSKKNYFIEDQSYEFYLNHARSGLVLAIQSLHLPANSKIGVMAYNCHTVMNAVCATNNDIVFIDIDKSLRLDLLDLNKKASDLKALIVTDLFGIGNDIQHIKTSYPNIIIIEDCAHAYLSQGCGKQGDFAVFSIGQGKFPSIGDGGILIVNNKKYLPQVRDIYLNLSNYNFLQHFLLFIKLEAKALLYKPILFKYVTSSLKKRKKNTCKIEVPHIKKMDPGIFSILQHLIPHLPKQLENRVRNTQAIIKEILPETVQPIISPNTYNCFMFPILCDNTSEIREYFNRHNIEVDTHFKECITWAKTYGYTENDCPTAEFLTNHLITIPTYTWNTLLKR